MAQILIIGKYYSPFEGGIEANTRDVAERLAQSHEVIALVHNHECGNSDATENRVRVIRCSTPLVIKSQPISPSMIRKVFQIEPDLIHFHAPNVLGNLAALLRIFGSRRHIPVVITHHMDVHGRALLRALVIPLYRILLRYSAAVIVTSLKNAAISRDLSSSAPVVPIPLGIDLSKYTLTDSQRAEALSWRRELAGASPTVGFVGRHARYKGLDVLVRAVTNLPEVHALISGDGPYRQSTIDLARALGVSDRTHFLGPVSHLKKLQLLAASDVFAFPSTETTEAFGVSQVEAMAVGTPVVASNLPTGVTDVAIDGRTALLASPNNPDAFSNCLARILNDKQLATQLSSCAREHVRRHLDQNVVLAQTETLITEVLVNSRLPPSSE